MTPRSKPARPRSSPQRPVSKPSAPPRPPAGPRLCHDIHICVLCRRGRPPAFPLQRPSCPLPRLLRLPANFTSARTDKICFESKNRGNRGLGRRTRVAEVVWIVRGEAIGRARNSLVGEGLDEGDGSSKQSTETWWRRRQRAMKRASEVPLMAGLGPSYAPRAPKTSRPSPEGPKKVNALQFLMNSARKPKASPADNKAR